MITAENPQNLLLIKIGNLPTIPMPPCFRFIGPAKYIFFKIMDLIASSFRLGAVNILRFNAASLFFKG